MGLDTDTFTQADGAQPLVAAIADYRNAWVAPSVNLFSGNLVVAQSDGIVEHFGPIFTIDDILFRSVAPGSTPAARTLTVPDAQVQAISRIPMQRAVSVSLIYNSSAASEVGSVGPGWRRPFDVTLSFSGAASESATVTWADGRRDLLLKSGPEWLGHSSLEARRLVVAGPGYELKARHGGAYVFSGAGRLTKIRDRNSNETVLAYSGGQLISVTDPVGRATTFGYDGSGHLTTITRPSASPTLLQYDGGGRLIRVTDPAGQATEYAYDTENRIVTMTESDGDELKIAYYSGLPVVRFANLGTTSRWFSFDGATRTTRVYDQIGPSTNIETAYQFDTRGLCTSVTDGPLGTTLSTYDPITLGRTTYTDPQSHTVEARYDASGDLTSVTDPLGNRDSVEREPTFHLPTKLLNPNLAAWVITRDANGNATSVQDSTGSKTEYTWVTGGLVTQIKDPREQTWLIGYNSHRDVTSVTDPAGESHTWNYDFRSNPLTRADEFHNSTSYTYTARDEPATATLPGNLTYTFTWRSTGPLESLQQPSGAQYTYDYDAANRLVRVTDPLSQATDIVRDPAGRVTRVADALMHGLDYTYDDAGRLTTVMDQDGSPRSYGYDCCNLTSSTDPTSQTISYTHDARDLLVSATSTGVTKTFAYDAVGRMRTAQLVASDDTTVTHTFAYDGAGRIIRHGKPHLMLNTFYRLDPAGLPLAVWDNVRPDSVRYAYDARGLPTLVEVTGPANFQSTLTWDPRWQLSSTTWNTGASSTYGYDALGRVTSVGNAGVGWSASYGPTYDLDSRLTQSTVSTPASGGVTLNLPHDTEGRLTGENFTPGNSYGYAYDAADRRVQKTTPSGTDLYSWAPDDRLLSAGATKLFWDAASRCTLMVLPAADTLRFGYRSDGALRSIRRGSQLWRTTMGPLGEMARWVLPTGARRWHSFDLTSAGLLRRSHYRGPGLSPGEDYILGPGLGDPIMWLQAPFNVASRRTLHPGLFEPTGQVADASGALLSNRHYGPFGELRYSGSGAGNYPAAGFAGMELVPGLAADPVLITAGGSRPESFVDNDQDVQDWHLSSNAGGDLYAPALGGACGTKTTMISGKEAIIPSLGRADEEHGSDNLCVRPPALWKGIKGGDDLEGIWCPPITFLRGITTRGIPYQSPWVMIETSATITTKRRHPAFCLDLIPTSFLRGSIP